MPVNVHEISKDRGRKPARKVTISTKKLFSFPFPKDFLSEVLGKMKRELLGLSLFFWVGTERIFQLRIQRRNEGYTTRTEESGSYVEDA